LRGGYNWLQTRILQGVGSNWSIASSPRRGRFNLDLSPSYATIRKICPMGREGKREKAGEIATFDLTGRLCCREPEVSRPCTGKHFAVAGAEKVQNPTECRFPFNSLQTANAGVAIPEFRHPSETFGCRTESLLFGGFLDITGDDRS